MAKQNINSKKGFTIIEVVLVLAIAGLIFLMVFVALPALQRSQRDTQRRNDISRVDTSLTQYQTNHTTGSNITNLPAAGVWHGDTDFDDCNTTACRFVREYLNSGSGDTIVNTFTDPDGTPYSMVITRNWGTDANPATDVNAAFPGDTLTIPDSESVLTETTTDSGAVGYTIGNTEGGNAYDEHVVYVIPGGACDGADAVRSTSRNYAILYRLEGAGVYCMDNQ